MTARRAAACIHTGSVVLASTIVGALGLPWWAWVWPAGVLVGALAFDDILRRWGFRW